MQVPVTLNSCHRQPQAYRGFASRVNNETPDLITPEPVETKVVIRPKDPENSELRTKLFASKKEYLDKKGKKREKKVKKLIFPCLIMAE